MSRSTALLLSASIALCACETAPSAPKPSPTPAPAPTPTPAAEAARPISSPRFVPGALPVAPFVAEQLFGAAPGERMLVYAGASWCEPCQRFHRAVEAGELDAELPSVRFVEYDYDVAKEALAADGYAARLIPLFGRPGPDGRLSGRVVAGSVKGDGAVPNIVPRLQALLGSR
jgi:thiol-disulfide isomerase/thioredoxin